MPVKEKYFNRYAVKVAVRIDFYSLEDFREVFFKAVQARFGELSFEKRPLTEEERELVDVDSISNNLAITLEDIINSRCILASPFTQKGQTYNLIIGSHFLYCDTIVTNYNKTIGEVESVFRVLLNFAGYGNCVSLNMLTCRTECGLFIERTGELGLIFDENFFPKSFRDLRNARYVDSYDDNGVVVDLIREYRRGINTENGKQIHSFRVESLSSIPSKNLVIEKELSLAIKTGKDYVEQCFK